PNVVEKRRSHQEIRFNVSIDKYPISNPEREISATILQNGRWLDAKTKVEPRYSRGDLINFEYIGEFLFPGSKEFRLVDTRSVEFTSPDIFRIDYYSDGYGVILQPDRPRLGLPHNNYVDLNGNFTVITADDPQTSRRLGGGVDSSLNIQDQLVEMQSAEVERQINNRLRSDYCSVEFFLDKPYELVDRDVYIIGSFNGWQLNPENKMQYKEGAYWCEIEMKQGLADYLYATTEIGKQEIDITEIEGSSFETRNEYLILVYQRSPVDRHDRIIGFKIFDSR
ncbi:MAG: DUF5103 domain-containing protein, partial [Saprospiraceae bacterium]|nr:DUF5103 domain-containing protein [Saprospiraceae bacterium]